VVASSRSGGIWVCKGRRLLKMQGDLISTVSTNLPWVAPGGIVREMFEDGNQGLWIGTDAHGLYRFADGKFIHVETSQSQIASIAQDGEGDIWVGTLGGGINRLRPKLFHLYDSRAGLPEDVSDGVCADERGDVWLANRRGGVARIRNCPGRTNSALTPSARMIAAGCGRAKAGFTGFRATIRIRFKP